jgi:hypothetical protein
VVTGKTNIVRLLRIEGRDFAELSGVSGSGGPTIASSWTVALKRLRKRTQARDRRRQLSIVYGPIRPWCMVTGTVWFRARPRVVPPAFSRVLRYA